LSLVIVAPVGLALAVGASAVSLRPELENTLDASEAEARPGRTSSASDIAEVSATVRAQRDAGRSVRFVLSSDLLIRSVLRRIEVVHV
jgi:hypothetical protein